MIGRQAKVLTPGDLRRLVSRARKNRFPKRDRVMVLLAVRAGLRAREIANLSWGMVLDANGRIASMIEVRDAIAKRGSGRRVPMHPELKKALLELWHCQTTEDYQPDAVIDRSILEGRGHASQQRRQLVHRHLPGLRRPVGGQKYPPAVASPQNQRPPCGLLQSHRR